MKNIFFLILLVFSIPSCFPSAKDQAKSSPTSESNPNEIDALIVRLNQVYPDTRLSREAAAAILQSAMEEHTEFLEENMGFATTSDFDDEWVFPNGLQESYQSVKEEMPEQAVGGLFPKKEERQQNWQYYNVASRHIRMQPQEAEHTGHLQMVRITLPETAGEDSVIDSPLGKVKSADHLVFSKEELRNYPFLPVYTSDQPQGYIPQLPEFERVDLVTPARYAGVRFAPLAIFLGYEKADDPAPSFYIYEAGDGVGNPYVLYLSPRMEAEIIQDSGYRPSPFADPDNIYTSRLEMEGDHPSFVSIKISRDLLDPVFFEIRMTLSPATYDEITGLSDFKLPVKQLIKAAARILKLQHQYQLPPIPDRSVEERIAQLDERIRAKAALGEDVSRLEARRAWLMDQDGE